METELRDPEAVVAAMRELAEKKQLDSFTVRIFVRGSVGQHWAWCTFGDSTFEQVASREEWLPDLVGDGLGGAFELTCFHNADRSRPIGVVRVEIPGPPSTTPRLAALQSPTWRGPREVLYPKPAEQRDRSREVIATHPVAVNAPGATETENARSHSELDDIKRRLVAAETALQGRIEALALRERQIEQGALAAQVQQRFEAIEARIRAPVAGKETDWASSIEKAVPAIVAALAPIMEIVRSGRDSEAKLSESINRSNERMSDAIRASADKTAEANQQTLSKITELIVARPHQDNAAAAESAKAMAMMASTVVNVLHQAKEVMGSPSEPPWYAILAEALPNVVREASYGRERARIEGSAPGQQRQLPNNEKPIEPERSDASGSVKDLVDMIYSSRAPAEVARYFFDRAVHTGEMKDAMEAVGFDLPKLVQKHVRASWLLTNAAYASSLSEAFKREAQTRGFLGSEPETPASPSADGASAPVA